jgi:hypothetical protein
MLVTILWVFNPAQDLSRLFYVLFYERIVVDKRIE